MKPVNLLPARYRPRSGASADSRTTYGALGVLGLLVVAVFLYVTAANQVSSRNAEIEETRERIAAAEAQVVTLKGFGDFATTKQARLTAVQSLATARLDWERVFRELAHVLPERVWLVGFDGRTVPDEGVDPNPMIRLEGCAATHGRVADAMVRLRELHVAQDVELTSTKGADPEETDSAAGSGSSAGCGRFYEFKLSVKIAPPSPSPGLPGAEDRVPARLGGGG